MYVCVYICMSIYMYVCIYVALMGVGSLLLLCRFSYTLTLNFQVFGAFLKMKYYYYYYYYYYYVIKQYKLLQTN